MAKSMISSNPTTRDTVSASGGVTAAHPLAVEAGASILRVGGNAADAAVATALALGVVDPANSGLGGYGGFAVIRPAPGRPVYCLDFNTVAPRAARQHTTQASGATTVSVPGVPRGLEALWKRFGTLPWKRLFEPAIALSERGFPVDDTLLETLNGAPIWSDAAGRAAFGDDSGRPLALGDRLRLVDYGRTLEEIAEQGAQILYRGGLAERLSAHVQASGGSLTWEDLQAYEVHWRAPLRMQVYGGSVYLGCKGSGGPVVATILGLLERLRPQLDDPSPETIAMTARAMGVAWRERGNVLDGARLQELAAEVTASDAPLATNSGPDAGHTTHLNTAGPEGGLAAMTLTHGPVWFGSGIVVPGTGLVLNNGLQLYDLPRPGHRAPSNMAPSLAEDARGRWLAVGTPGARRIVSLVALTLYQGLAGHSGDSLMKLPRFHHDSGRRLYLDSALASSVGGAMRLLGWEVQALDRRHYYGPASVIEFDEGEIRAETDNWFRGAAVLV